MDVPGLRGVTPDDARAAFELITLCELAESGEAWCTLGEIDAEFADASTVAAVIDNPVDGIDAYAWVTPSPQRRVGVGGFFIRPGSDWSVAPGLVDWLRRRTAELDEGFALHCVAAVENPARRRVYEAAGGVVVRRYYRMGIAIDDRAVAPTPPAAVAVSSVSDDDLPTMHCLIESGFADHYQHEPRSFDEWRRHEADGACPDRGLWWLASVAGVPAAGLYGCQTEAGGYVDRLATLRDFRGRGLGTLLLRTAFAEFARRGMAKVSLSVDAANATGALSLYASVGMCVEHEELRFELAPLAG